MAMKTAKSLVDYVISMVGHPYWYGTYGQVATTSLLTAKTKQYPSHYPSTLAAQRKKEVQQKLTVTDCYGLAKGFGWTSDSGKIVYGSNGVKDVSANSIYASASVKGAIRTIPEKPGVCVRYDGHFGVYIGNGYVVEARGRNYGVVKTKLSARSWTHWFQLPYIDYGEQSGAKDASGVFGESSLKRGDSGENVITLQTLLLKAGMKLANYGADGNYGAETEDAVKAYQKKIERTQTGVADPGTIKRLIQDTTDDADNAQEAEPLPLVRVQVTATSVYIRKGPDKDRFDSVGIAKDGDILEALADQSGAPAEVNGWYAVLLNGTVRWISGKYLKKG